MTGGSSDIRTCISTSCRHGPPGSTRRGSGFRSRKESPCTAPSPLSLNSVSTLTPSSRPKIKTPNLSSGPKPKCISAASKVTVSANCDSVGGVPNDLKREAMAAVGCGLHALSYRPPVGRISRLFDNAIGVIRPGGWSSGCVFPDFNAHGVAVHKGIGQVSLQP